MRPYKSNDLKAMQALLGSQSVLDDQYPGAGDMPEILDPAVSDTPRNTVVWEDGVGRVQGFALIDQYDNLHYFILAEHLTDELEDELAAWVSLRGKLIASSRDIPVVLGATVRDHDSRKKLFLLRHGFTPSGEQTLHMSRSLSDPLPAPVLAPGFSIRLLAGEDEVDAYVAVHRLAYGTERMTREMRQAIMCQPCYRPDLDLIIDAPDGMIAAFCVCSIYDDENQNKGLMEGEISIVGVHTDFRHRGLGEAAVLAGLMALKNQGMESAFLSVVCANKPAIRVYQAAGFRVKWTTDWYQMEMK